MVVVPDPANPQAVVDPPGAVAAGGPTVIVPPVTGPGSPGIERELLESILVHLPLAVAVLDDQLRFTLVNERAAAINGRTAADHIGCHLYDVVPGLPSHFGQMLRGVVATGVPVLNVDVAGRAPGRPGQHRWRGSYYPVFGGPSAVPVGVAAIFAEVDTTDDEVKVADLAADRATSLAVLETLVANAPVGVAALDTELRFLRINPMLAALNGRSVAEHVGRSLSEVVPAIADIIGPVLREVATTGDAARDIEMTFAGRTWLTSYFAIPRPTGGVAGVAIVVFEVTERRRAEQRARLLHAFTAALSQATTVAEVAVAVSDAGARAAGAQVAAVALLDGRAGLLRYAPNAAATDWPAATWAPVDVRADRPVAEAFRTGRPVFLGSLDELLGTYPLLAGLPIVHRSWAVVPLTGHGTSPGVLAFAFDDGQEFDAEQRDTLTTIAGLAAQALARAQLYEREHDTAVRLQRSLLPSRLPEIPGVRSAAVYVAGDAAEVGGDFYDVFAVPGDGGAQWAVVVGDVAGRGVDAASVTGLARHTLRVTAALSSPVEALRQLHGRLMDDPDVDRFVSVVCGRLHPLPSGVTLELASAGHPPALVRRAGGTVEVVEVPGIVLGAVATTRVGERRVDLHPGDTVVFYTDGVLEARGPDGLFGQDRLVELLGSVDTGDPGLLVERVRDAVAAYQIGPIADDLAVLALHVDPV
jgi:serine phosphatase RsbU (regulator of sigma subunit)/PAS domain-containing protein